MNLLLLAFVLSVAALLPLCELREKKLSPSAQRIIPIYRDLSDKSWPYKRRAVTITSDRRPKNMFSFVLHWIGHVLLCQRIPGFLLRFLCRNSSFRTLNIQIIPNHIRAQRFAPISGKAISWSVRARVWVCACVRLYLYPYVADGWRRRRNVVLYSTSVIHFRLLDYREQKRKPLPRYAAHIPHSAHSDFAILAYISRIYDRIICSRR